MGEKPLKLRVEIDKHSLEDEWAMQSEQYAGWADKQAELESDVEIARVNLDAVESELFTDISSHPGTYGLEKTTDKAVQAAVKEQPAFKNATRKHLDLKRDLAKVKAIVKSLEMRKSALANLVNLWVHDYYSDHMPKGNNLASREFVHNVDDDDRLSKERASADRYQERENRRRLMSESDD